MNKNREVADIKRINKILKFKNILIKAIKTVFLDGFFVLSKKINKSLCSLW